MRRACRGKARLFSVTPVRQRPRSHLAVVRCEPIRTSRCAARGQVVASQAGKTASESSEETSNAFVRSACVYCLYGEDGLGKKREGSLPKTPRNVSERRVN